MPLCMETDLRRFCIRHWRKTAPVPLDPFLIPHGGRNRILYMSFSLSVLMQEWAMVYRGGFMKSISSPFHPLSLRRAHALSSLGERELRFPPRAPLGVWPYRPAPSLRGARKPHRHNKPSRRGNPAPTHGSPEPSLPCHRMQARRCQALYPRWIATSRRHVA